MLRGCLLHMGGSAAAYIIRHERSCQKRKTNMAILTGNVKSSRVVTGEYKTGKRQGEDWEFLALEVIDAVTGFVWSCQLASEDGSYQAGAKVVMVWLKS